MIINQIGASARYTFAHWALDSTLERFLWSIERLSDLGYKQFSLEILEPSHVADPEAISKLENLAQEITLCLVRLGGRRRERGTHEKILIQDNKPCVVGSFSWLSYDGRDNNRHEMSIALEGPSNVQGLLGQIMRELEMASAGLRPIAARPAPRY